MIHLQFWAYGYWDSLHPISMSPHCKVMSPKHYLITSLPYYCILGLAEIKTHAQKMQDAQVTKSLVHPDENNNIGLVYCACADIDSSVYGCLATVHKVGLTAPILFHLRVEQLGSPWFLTVGLNHILKTLIDNISKTSSVNPRTTGIWCRKHLFS